MKYQLLRAASIVSLSAAAVVGTASPVLAQDSDVLVMRRTIAPAKDPSTTLSPVEGADTTGHYWVVSGWIKGEPMCSDAAEETRLRGCVFNGKTAPEKIARHRLLRHPEP